MAVVLTYLAISTSYVPVAIVQFSKTKAAKPASPTQAKEAPSIGVALLGLAVLAVAAPFLSLTGGVGGIISLLIIFFGLQRAWRMTARPDIVISGPFQTQAAT
jgi:hypothetical protein